MAQSIRANGIIQPLVLRKAGDRYQLVAGERRWRAAKLAGLDTVPVVVQDIPDDRLLEITLVENIQREDLNPIETANAFNRLGTELSLSAEEIGRRTGKDRTTIANSAPSPPTPRRPSATRLRAPPLRRTRPLSPLAPHTPTSSAKSPRKPSRRVGPSARWNAPLRR